MNTSGFLIAAIVVGLICGGICVAISYSRGMEGGFWWGFLLGIIGIVVVAVRPNDRPAPSYSSSSASSDSYYSSSSSYLNTSRTNDALSNGGWRCPNCGKLHYSYESGCSCGASKFSQIESQPESEPESKALPAGIEDAPVAVSQADEIRKFKELLDDGILTQEEFEAKKKQLLGL